ncbi:MAG: hypothetical protein AAB588_01135 [Patescibacteria group bacterium]
MSTLNGNITGKRIALLASKGEKIFHIADMANLWQIQDKNTLRITLNRYVQQGLLHGIYRGFYSLIPPQDLSPLFLGSKALHRFCFVSTETILSQEGYISPVTNYYTFIANRSRIFTLFGYLFKSRQLADRYLYNSEGVALRGGLLQASPERAIADMLYFNPSYHFDHPVDWKKVRDIQQKVGYPLTPKRYDSAKTH